MKQELVIFPGQHVELRLAFVVTMQCPENLLLFFFTSPGFFCFCFITMASGVNSICCIRILLYNQKQATCPTVPRVVQDSALPSLHNHGPLVLY